MYDLVFEVLAEPHRRRILDLLREGERPVGDLVTGLGLSQPGVSKHLRILRHAGLVQVRAVGQRRLYRLQPDGLRQVDEWLAPYRAAWRGHLDALETHLAEMHHDPGTSQDTDNSKRRGRRDHGEERDDDG
ncbi:MAG TPA: metalloregulator ArsR/SmtB family transcription factor [Streptosporangiaceae bacterium]|nr:metalloregulator ArsR/SmtB family transcription factor [Streptosporangiaceae bacterium]